MTTITIQTTRGGEKRTEGRKVTEHFAVHRNRDDDGKPIRGCWTITHLPTGYGMPGPLSNERKAAAAARAVQGCGADWDFTDPRIVKEWDEDQRRAVYDAVAPFHPEDHRFYLAHQYGIRLH